MSTPALNPRPSARRITTRVASSLPASSSARASSNQPATVKALTGGASIVIVTIPVVPVSERMLTGSPLEQTKHLLGRVPVMSLSVDLAGRVALVTGGAQGIGAAIS